MKKIVVEINENLLSRVKEMCDEKGITISAIVREAIYEHYRKMFPPYIRKISEKRKLDEFLSERSDEELCELVGGKISDDGNICNVKTGAYNHMNMTIPLGNMKDRIKDGSVEVIIV